MPEDRLDPVSAWRELREIKGRRTTVIDLYRLVSGPRGLEPHQLPLHERLDLARSVMPLLWPGFTVTEGSARADLIQIVEYDATWPSLFNSWRARILDVLGDVARRVDHVGSTSVPGLAAEPIVDIQLSVRDMNDEQTYVRPLERIGVQMRSRDSLHRYFRPFPGMAREVHVHVCDVGSEWEREHLLFRDYLRHHPHAAEEYAMTKREAVRLWADDGWAYTDAKTDAILGILEAAESWAAREGWQP